MAEEVLPVVQRGLARWEMPAGLDVMRLGEMMAKSGFFADTREAAQAVVKIIAGQELGIGPVAAMTGIHIVQGRITLSANLIAAAIRRSGRYGYRIRELTEERCVLEFFEGAESVGVTDFTLKDAEKAQLAAKPIWKQYPRNMLFARAMSNGARFYCPDVFGGPIYTPEELGASVAVGEDGTVEVVELPTVEPLPAVPMSDTAKAVIADMRAAVAESEVPAVPGDEVDYLTGEALGDAIRRMRAAMEARRLPLPADPVPRNSVVAWRAWWHACAAVLAAADQEPAPVGG